MESYAVPKRLVARGTVAKLSPIFRDREELASASDLSQTIDAALRDSRALIVVCSPAAASSQWVNEEVARFIALGRHEQIYCVLTAGEPNADRRGFDASLECLPAALRESGDREPIAVDLRRQGDGRQNAKLKLIAGLLGVGLDELRRRDLQRRMRRLAWLTAGSAAGLVITSTLAVVAVVARNDAEENRVKAERERETARQTTQFMVGLFNVVDPGEARGRTVTAHEILELGVSRISRELQGQPEVRSSLMQTMGRVFTGLGLYPRATELLRGALVTQEALGAADVEVTRVALGDAFYLNGNYDLAEQHYREAMNATSQDSTWSAVRSEAANGLADVLTQNDDLDAAIALYREALTRDRDTFGAESAQVARSANGLATALLYRGETKDAEANYLEANAAYRAAMGVDHPKFAETINNLGAVHYFNGDPVGAAARYREALPLYRSLYGNDHPEVAMILNNLGRIELEQADVEAALPLLEESVAIDRRLGRADHDDFVFGLNSLGVAYRASNDLERAGQCFEEAEQLAGRHEHRMWGPILVNRAEWLCATGQSGATSEMLRHARRLIAKDYPDEPWRAAIADSVEGYCLGQLGMSPAAERLLSSSLPVIVERWGEQSLFGQQARARLDAYARRR